MRSVRASVALTIGAVALLVAASPASAHVVIPGEGTKGDELSVVTLTVPNELDSAQTTSVEVQLPQDQVLTFVAAQPKAGWTVTTTTRKLDKPLTGDSGSITEVVDTVKWSGGKIGVGQFDLFSLEVGPLPTTVDELTFPVVQTYSNGDAVRWIDPAPAGGAEAEHPVPVFKLVDATATPDGAAGGSKDRDGLAIVALAAALVALVAGAGSIAMGRRRA